MTEQEEILKAVKTCIAIEQSCGEFDGRRLAKNILRIEHELGVVIKVDRELPIPEYMFLDGHSDTHYITQNAFASSVSEKTQQKMLKAGYVAVEPLIKEKEANGGSSSA